MIKVFFEGIICATPLILQPKIRTQTMYYQSWASHHCVSKWSPSQFSTTFYYIGKNVPFFQSSKLTWQWSAHTEYRLINGRDQSMCRLLSRRGSSLTGIIRKLFSPEYDVIICLLPYKDCCARTFVNSSHSIWRHNIPLSISIQGVSRSRRTDSRLSHQSINRFQ